MKSSKRRWNNNGIHHFQLQFFPNTQGRKPQLIIYQTWWVVEINIGNIFFRTKMNWKCLSGSKFCTKKGPILDILYKDSITRQKLTPNLNFTAVWLWWTVCCHWWVRGCKSFNTMDIMHLYTNAPILKREGDCDHYSWKIKGDFLKLDRNTYLDM